MPSPLLSSFPPSLLAPRSLPRALSSPQTLVLLSLLYSPISDAVTDAMVAARRAEGTNVTAAIHNAGGIRATISGPKITQSDVLTSFPFGNSLVDIQLTGAQLWDVVEGTVSGVNSANVVRP
jgi:2',3'-cyclic-nucleotide 2'-phosphodiesterase (5'-nucleotidase family)